MERWGWFLMNNILVCVRKQHMGHYGIRVLKWSNTCGDRCILGSGGSGGDHAQNRECYQCHTPIRPRPECLAHVHTPHLPRLQNGNTPTLSLTWLHEGTISAVITENKNALTGSCTTWWATVTAPHSNSRISAEGFLLELKPTTSGHHPYCYKQYFSCSGWHAS